MNQKYLMQNLFKSNLNKISRGRYKSKEQKSVLENIKLLYESKEVVIILFNDYSSIASEAKYKTIHGKWIPSMSPPAAHGKVSDHWNLKILSAKQMLQRLPIALAQVKSGNTCENLLNEIRQIKYFLFRAKEITKKVYNKIMNLVKLWKRMDAILMNSKNSKTSDPHRLLLILPDKIDSKRSDKHVALSNLSICYT